MNTITTEVISALIYATLGIVVFFLILGLIEKITNYSISHKIAQENNIALGIVLGSIILSVGLIISSAIR
jgi:uncharacterized membrane protein YjfL (UPF0719 family)